MTLCVGQAPATELHYAPIKNLELLDFAQLNTARRTIDMAAVLLSDRPVIDVLKAAAYRGGKIRIYLDGRRGKVAEREAPHLHLKPLATADVAGVELLQ